ncbi:uncharacterized protein PV06_08382 [Exophiala oligosperma]|uniref:Putative gamma-glutamylcyclotransferase n=1 Tax=Exophiala oligosperma TaxID=215243 RepID=A0A0D2D9K6_9EURO|nr:uncharacterized protein PV06_08382 [Exophiala oligosperma]KIW39798.1 hypothetical protein PV06_08382 [Exophiala oligosperma]
MDILAELESMAVNVATAAAEEETIPDVDVERWQKLFGFTISEARAALETYRRDLFRTKISDELWDTVGSDKQAEGYDREAYEYSLTRPRRHDSSGRYDEKGSYIVQLTGPLHSPEILQRAATLNRVPTPIGGVGECGQAEFCEIDGAAKARLLSWARKYHCGFQPTIIRLSKAKKELSEITQAPTLGNNLLTLPQHRPDDVGVEPTPSPGQYPVWYFFYGTLADPDVLSRQLGLEEAPHYVPAKVSGGRVRTWAAKYKALVDAPGEEVPGSAFLVQSASQEDALRFYETDKYEVVRCKITTQTEVLDGLTFRFDGSEDDLDQIH